METCVWRTYTLDVSAVDHAVRHGGLAEVQRRRRRCQRGTDGPEGEEGIVERHKVRRGVKELKGKRLGSQPIVDAAQHAAGVEGSQRENNRLVGIARNNRNTPPGKETLEEK